MGPGKGIQEARVRSYYFANEGREGESWAKGKPYGAEIINVMLVGKLEENLYKRIAVGKIVKKAWETASPGGLVYKGIFLA